MNRCVAILLCLCVALCVQAQDYSKFRVGITGGYATRDSEGVGGKGGPAVGIEPAFRIADKILIGLRTEGTIRSRSLSKPGAQSIPLTASLSGSLVGQYYFSEKVVRMFAGAGGGFMVMTKEPFLYHPDFIGPVNAYIIGKNQPCFFGRLGLEASHFILLVEYNYSPSEQVTPALEIKNSYASIKIGFFLGGGFNFH